MKTYNALPEKIEIDMVSMSCDIADKVAIISGSNEPNTWSDFISLVFEIAVIEIWNQHDGLGVEVFGSDFNKWLDENHPQSTFHLKYFIDAHLDLVRINAELDENQRLTDLEEEARERIQAVPALAGHEVEIIEWANVVDAGGSADSKLNMIIGESESALIDELSQCGVIDAGESESDEFEDLAYDIQKTGGW